MSKDINMSFFDPEDGGIYDSQHLEDLYTVNNGDTLAVKVYGKPVVEMGDLLPSPAKHIEGISTRDGELIFTMTGNVEYNAGNVTSLTQLNVKVPEGKGVLTPEGNLKLLKAGHGVEITETVDDITISSTAIITPVRTVNNKYTPLNSKSEFTVTTAGGVSQDLDKTVNEELLVFQDVHLGKGRNELTLNVPADTMGIFDLIIKDSVSDAVIKRTTKLISDVATSSVLNVKEILDLTESKTVNIYFSSPDENKWIISTPWSAWASITLTHFSINVKTMDIDPSKFIEYVPDVSGGSSSLYTEIDAFIDRQSTDFEPEIFLRHFPGDGYLGLVKRGNIVYLIPGTSSYVGKYDLTTLTFEFIRTGNEKNSWTAFKVIEDIVYIYRYNSTVTKDTFAKLNLATENFTIHYINATYIADVTVDYVTKNFIAINTSNLPYHLDLINSKVTRVDNINVTSTVALTGVEYMNSISKYGIHYTGVRPDQYNQGFKLWYTGGRVIGQNLNKGIDCLYSISNKIAEKASIIEKVNGEVPSLYIDASSNSDLFSGIYSDTTVGSDNNSSYSISPKSKLNINYSDNQRAPTVENPGYFWYNLPINDEPYEINAYSIETPHSAMNNASDWDLLGCHENLLKINKDFNFIPISNSFYSHADSRYNLENLFKSYGNIPTTLHDNASGKADKTVEFDIELLSSDGLKEICYKSGPFNGTMSPAIGLEIQTSENGTTWEVEDLLDLERPEGEQDIFVMVDDSLYGINKFKTPLTLKALELRSKSVYYAGFSQFHLVIENSEGQPELYDPGIKTIVSKDEVIMNDDTKFTVSEAYSDKHGVKVCVSYDSTNRTAIETAYVQPNTQENWLKAEFATPLKVLGFIAITGNAAYTNSTMKLTYSEDGTVWKNGGEAFLPRLTTAYLDKVVNLDRFINSPVYSIIPTHYNESIYTAVISNEHTNYLALKNRTFKKYVKFIFKTWSSYCSLGRLYLNRKHPDSYEVLDTRTKTDWLASRKYEFTLGKDVSYNAFILRARGVDGGYSYWRMGHFNVYKKNFKKKDFLKHTLIDMSTGNAVSSKIEFTDLKLEDYSNLKLNKYFLTNSNVTGSNGTSKLIDGDINSSYIGPANVAYHQIRHDKSDCNINMFSYRAANVYWYISGRRKYWQSPPNYIELQGLNEENGEWETIKKVAKMIVEKGHLPLKNQVTCKGIRASIPKESNRGFGNFLPIIKEGETVKTLELTSSNFPNNREVHYSDGTILTTNANVNPTYPLRNVNILAAGNFMWDDADTSVDRGYVQYLFSEDKEIHSVLLNTGNLTHISQPCLLEYTLDGVNWLTLEEINLLAVHKTTSLDVDYLEHDLLDMENKPIIHQVESVHYFRLDEVQNYNEYRFFLRCTTDGNPIRVGELKLFNADPSLDTNEKIEAEKSRIDDVSKLLNSGDIEQFFDGEKLIAIFNKEEGLLGKIENGFLTDIVKPNSDLNEAKKGTYLPDGRFLQFNERDILSSGIGNELIPLYHNNAPEIYDNFLLSDAFTKAVYDTDLNSILKLPRRHDSIRRLSISDDTLVDINLPGTKARAYNTTSLIRYRNAIKLQDTTYIFPYNEKRVVAVHPPGKELDRPKFVNPTDNKESFWAVPKALEIPHKYIGYEVSHPNTWKINNNNLMRCSLLEHDEDNLYCLATPDIGYVIWSFTKPTSISALNIRMGTNLFPNRVRVLYSDDKINWTELVDYTLTAEDKVYNRWMSALEFAETSMKYLKLEIVDTPTAWRLSRVVPTTTLSKFTTDDYWRTVEVDGHEFIKSDGTTPEDMCFRTAIKLSETKALVLPFKSENPIIIDNETGTYSKVEGDDWDGTIHNFTYSFRNVDNEIIAVKEDGSSYIVDDTFKLTKLKLIFPYDVYESVLTKGQNRYFLSRNTPLFRLNLSTMIGEYISFTGSVVSTANYHYTSIVAYGDKILLGRSSTETGCLELDLKTRKSTESYNRDSSYQYADFCDLLIVEDGSILMVSDRVTNIGGETDTAPDYLLRNQNATIDPDLIKYLEVEG